MKEWVVECQLRMLQREPLQLPAFRLLQVRYGCVDLDAILEAELTSDSDGKGASYQLMAVVYKLCTVIGEHPKLESEKFDVVCRRLHSRTKSRSMRAHVKKAMSDMPAYRGLWL